MSRVLVVGLDGADPSLVERFTTEGAMPNLRRVITQGGWAPLESTLPPMSAGAWTSFMTAKRPGKHGVYDFMERGPDTYGLRPSRRSTEPTLWGMLSANQRRVAVVNVPQTYPPEQVNGVMISGLGTPIHRHGVYPPALAQYVLQAGFRKDVTLRYKIGHEADYLRDVREAMESQFGVAHQLLRQEPWDLFVYVIRATDEVCHFFWRFMDETHPAFDGALAMQYGETIREVYKRADVQLGDLMREAGDEADVFVLSDHGMGPLHKNVFLNTWLHRTGMLSYRAAADQGSGVRGLLRRLGVTRSGLTHVLDRAHLGRVHLLLKRLLGSWLHHFPEDREPRLVDRVDWEKTLAYSHGYIGQIYVNLTGREPDGIVAPEGYDELCADLTHRLKGLVDPADGEPVVDCVIRGRDANQGPYADQGPDLIVLMRGLRYITHEGYEIGDEDAGVFVEPLTGESGGHRIHGILAAAGPSIEWRRPVDDLSIVDIAPTILRVLGLPHPRGSDGRPRYELLHKDIASCTEEAGGIAARAILSRDEGWSDEDEASVTKRLQDLGYL